MRRAILIASFLTLAAIGSVAYAGCRTCFEAIVAERTDSTVTLTITATSGQDVPAFPPSVTAVVMQVDGQRTKCLTLILQKAAQANAFAFYVTTFSAYGQKAYSGRVDVGGVIYEFTVPLDGRAGTFAVAVDQSALQVGRIAVQATAAPATPAATPAPTRAPQVAESLLNKAAQTATQPVFLLGAFVVVVTLVGAYVDRRRALARSLAG